MIPQNIARGVNTKPVSPAELYQTICDATSQDPQLLQPSLAKLKELFQQSGVYDALHEISATRTVPLPVRIQASIQFKNEALKNWKSRKLQTDENRARIRNRCMTFLDEEDATIADCNKVAVAKIARMEYPQQWPTLVDDLLMIVNQNLPQRYASVPQDHRATLMLQRALQLLCGVTKEFSRIKVPSGMTTMKNIFERLYLSVSSHYVMVIESMQMNPDPQSLENPETYTDLILSHLLFKTLESMATWIWLRHNRMTDEEKATALPWLEELFRKSVAQLQKLVGWRAEMISRIPARATFSLQASATMQLLTKHIRRFGKLYIRMSEVNPRELAQIPETAAAVMFYWNQVIGATKSVSGIEDKPTALYPVRFLVQGLVLFKDLVGQWTSQRRDGTLNPNSLPKEFIEDAVKLIVTRLLPLTAADIEGWKESPEEWVQVEDQENAQWEYELRACSERVLMQISNQYPEYVTPLLKETFEKVADKPADADSVLMKEALYCALGRCCQRLQDEIPFEAWVNRTLSVEAQDNSPYAFVLKRRIAWLIGKWLSEACCPPNNPIFWQILVHLLGVQGDGARVIQLTAAVALREGVDTLDFDLEIFAPFFPQAVDELMKLIGDTDSFDSKRKVDDALNVVIDRAGDKIIPLVHLVSAPIPKLWMDAEDNWLFKSSLLVTVTNLVKAIGTRSTGLASIVVPLVEDSINQGEALDGDGVALWKEALRNTTSIDSPDGSPSLANLIPLAIRHLESNLDLLGSVLNIIESYFLLDGARILQECLDPFTICPDELFRAFKSALTGTAMKQNKKDALSALSLLVQLTPSSLWGQPMHSSGLFPHLVDILITDEEETQILCEIIYLISRIALADRNMFLTLMEHAAQVVTAGRTNKHNTPWIPLGEAKMYDLFMDKWWGTFDSMSEPRHRKLVAMSSAALVSTARPEILSRLHSEIFNLWMDVFAEIKEAQNPVALDDDGQEVPSYLTLYWEQKDAPASFYQGTEGTPEYDRRKMVYDNDPVRTVQLSQFVGARLQEAEATCGPTFQQLYLAKVDPTVLQQIQNELR